VNFEKQQETRKENNFWYFSRRIFCVSFCVLFYYLFSLRIFFRQFLFSPPSPFLFSFLDGAVAALSCRGGQCGPRPVVHTTTTMGATVSLPMSVLPSAGRDALEAQIWDTLSLRKTPSGATRTPPLHFILLPKQSSQLPPKKTRNPPLAAVSPSPAASPAPQNGPAHPLEDPLLHPTTTHPAMTGVPPSATMP